MGQSPLRKVPGVTYRVRGHLRVCFSLRGVLRKTLWKLRTLLGPDYVGQLPVASQFLVTNPPWDFKTLCQGHNIVPILQGQALRSVPPQSLISDEP